MNTIIPMAGLGTRFRDAGYRIPKPLIPVLGKPMYAWAVESLPLRRSRQTIFVLLRSQPEFDELQRDIIARFAASNPVVFSVPQPTPGQSATVLAARELIANDEPLLIHNADTAFTMAADWVGPALQCGADGALLVFPSRETRWSFSREDEAGWVVEVREKQVIAPWASTGTYWFRRGRDFVRLAEARIAQGQKEGGEYYVAPLYNDMIAQGGKAKNYRIDKLYCFGTPQDLEQTLPVLTADLGGKL